jgi:hypothetical protein
LRPHKSIYWLFPKIGNEEEFVLRIERVCVAYGQGDCETIVSSSDEKTGIQALNHLEVLPMEAGKSKKVESEYSRNGTSCLIASRNVATGAINAFQLGQTRKEGDYLRHIQDIYATAPSKKHLIVCDQLNTHKSASLVEWVASVCCEDIELGIKGKEGILKSQESRMAFLEDTGHRIRFLYTPKHCSWMNQIENWFAILQRKVIKCGQFPSVDELENNIIEFISYYNDILVKPVEWSFNAKKYRRKLKI